MRPVNVLFNANETLSDLLDLVCNAPRLRERVQQLYDMQKQIAADIGDREKLAQIEDLKQVALSASAEAQKLKSDAEDYAARIKAEANALYDQRMGKIDLRAADLDIRTAGLDAKEKEVRGREIAVAAKEVEIDRREKEVMALSDRIKAGNARVDKLQAELESRLAAINQIAAGGASV